MDIQSILAKMNEALAPYAQPSPETVSMTPAEFFAHAQGQIDKAKTEPAELAKARLAHLSGVVSTLAKASWEGTTGASIPVYVEPNLTATKDDSDTTKPILADAGKGTQADGVGYAAPAGAQGFAKSTPMVEQLAALNASITSFLATPPEAAPPAPPAPPAGADAWPSDVNTPAFMAEGVAKRAAADGDGWGVDPWAKR